MKINEVRTKYLEFFKERKHAQISPAPLVLDNDPTTLFTSSGMQPLVPYLLGQTHPEGVRLVDSQPSIRLQDIEEVGDNRHTTFFEMLGNWSLGDYFKKEQLNWIFEFITSKDSGLGLDPERLYVSVFSGDKECKIQKKGKLEILEKDEESITIWKDIFKKIGITAKEDERIFAYPAKKNWWSRSGTPAEMPVGEIGGPDSEIFYDFGADLKLHENSPFKNEKCHPNCDCGRFVEIGNSVFMQYKKIAEGIIEELPHKNVDFGGGLERMTAATIHSQDVFNIDVFASVIKEIENFSDKKYENENMAPMRIIADHLRASVFLMSYGVIPGNKGQGYILRRLLRRAAIKMNNLGGGLTPIPAFQAIAQEIISTYKEVYFDFEKTKNTTDNVIDDELKKFGKTLDRGLKIVEKTEKIDGKIAFDLYQSYGFPVEITEELALAKGQTVDREVFRKEFEKHKELSRTASAGMFKGGLLDHSVETTKYHTATHLLHAALRQVLGNHVSQKGSNITGERLRFDFSHPQKLTEEELKKVEEIVNENIKKDLPVSCATKTYKEAVGEGALAFFGEKYGEKVKVYTVGDPQGGWASKEVCGGPHVTRTGEIGHVRITKQDKVGSGVMRIYAVTE
jgi:alanyl-tRNA synthetase